MMVHKLLKSFKHINQEERIEIYKLKSSGFSIRSIAKLLHRDHSSISRELARNSFDSGRGIYSYKPIQAEKYRIARRQKANFNHIKLKSNHSLRQKIFYFISTKHRGPDEIIGRLKLEGRTVVSTSTLYRFIFNYTNWTKFLRFKHYHKRYNKETRGCLNHIPLIDLRPSEANNRSEIGHWECDTVVGQNHLSGLITITDRKSRFELIMKTTNLTKQSVYSKLRYMLHNHTVKSLTSDNGKEFSDNHKLPFDVFRAHPYSPYERPSNERHNGLIRQFIPKGSDINSYLTQDIQSIQNILNHKPRKILNYLTPYEVYYNTNLTYIN